MRSARYLLFIEGASGDWEAIEEIYIGLVSRIPRAPTLCDVTSILEEMELLQRDVVNILEMQQEDGNISTNATQNERHLQNSKPESFHEFEPSLNHRV